MDDLYRFVFIRKDLTLRQQLVQSNHAAYLLGTITGELSGIPNVVTIGVDNLDELNKVLEICSRNHIPNYRYYEPDGDLGFTAIATVPIDREQKKVFSDYQTWR